MAKAPIWQWGAVETAKAIKSGKVSSEEVVKASIDRMKAVNPKLNAVVVDMSKEALKAAKAADKALAKGEAVGPLHGVPVTIKINLDVKGQANSNGVVAFKDNIAPDDSAVTGRVSLRWMATMLAIPFFSSAAISLPQAVRLPKSG